MSEKTLTLIFPYYTDWSGFNKESLKDLKDQPVLMEFFTQFEELLNIYIKDPKEKQFKELDDFVHEKIKQQTIEFIEKGHYSPNKPVFGKRITTQVKEIIKCVAEKKQYAQKEKCVHAVDEMVSQPITPQRRNEIMTEGSVSIISQLFNGSGLECYVLMAKGHVKDIVGGEMLNNLIQTELKLKLVKKTTDSYNTIILEYSN
jgi:hypothetical protein